MQAYSFKDGRILNSICTGPLPVAVEAYMRTIHTNLGDTRIFPGAKELELKAIAMMSDLFGNKEAVGNIVSGYAVMKYLGRQGFIAITRDYFKKRDYLIGRLEEEGSKLKGISENKKAPGVDIVFTLGFRVL